MTLLSDYSNRHKQAQQLCVELVEILNSNLSWENKYRIVFDTANNKIWPLIGGFEYYDPGTSYEEDARSYVEALRDYLTDLEERLTCEE